MEGEAGAVDAEAALAGELFNRQVAQTKLELLGERAARLQRENEELRARHDAREQETHEFVAYFQREIQARDKQLSKLGDELAAAKLSHALALEAAQQARESEAAQLAHAAASKEESLSEQLFLVREELHQLEVFRDVKEAMAVRLRDLEAALAQAKAQAAEDSAALERKFIEERGRQQKEHEKALARVRQQAKEDARNGLDADTRKIVTDNRRMGEELRFQLHATDELARDKAALEARAHKLQLDAQLARDKEGEYARQAQRQARELAQLRADLRALEKQASANLAAAQRDRHAALAEGEREREDLALDADGLRRLLRLKNKELRSLRRLAQAVLDQRSDVEQFFLDALAHVRRELAAERSEQRAAEREQYQADMRRAIGLPPGGGSSSIRFPKLSAGASSPPPPGNKPRGLQGKVDLRELSWEDRERVLRLVFARINGSQSAVDAGGVADADARLGSPDAGLGGSNNSSNQRSSVVYFATEAADPADSGGDDGLGLGPSEASMSLTGLPIVPRAPPQPAAAGHHRLSGAATRSR